MKLAFDKGQVPYSGRIAIVDPIVEATFNKKVTLTAGADRTPKFEMAWEEGFQRDHKFFMHIYGWDIYVSNRLPSVAAGTSVDGTNTITNTGVANIFMCVADDGCKPLMTAWRRLPKAETERDMDNQRDKFITTTRFGMGVQRLDTLGVIVCDATVSA